MEHFEWQSDAPAPDDTKPWAAPDWVVYGAFACVVGYLLVGLGFAIYDAATATQTAGSMAVLSFILEIIVWPAKFLLPLIQ